MVSPRCEGSNKGSGLRHGSEWATGYELRGVQASRGFRGYHIGDTERGPRGGPLHSGVSKKSTRLTKRDLSFGAAVMAAVNLPRLRSQVVPNPWSPHTKRSVIRTLTAPARRSHQRESSRAGAVGRASAITHRASATAAPAPAIAAASAPARVARSRHRASARGALARSPSALARPPAPARQPRAPAPEPGHARGYKVHSAAR